MSRLLRRLVPQYWEIFFRKWSKSDCFWSKLGKIFKSFPFFFWKITRFWPFWKKIYLYTSASAFSEILQRLKQNSKTSCDLGKLPTEVGVKILKCLDATGMFRLVTGVNFKILFKIWHWHHVYGMSLVLIGQFGWIYASERGVDLLDFILENQKAGNHFICY